MPDFPKTRIKFRKGTAAEFSSANPVLASGEPGFAVDTNTLKIGNGATAWNSLSGISGGGGGGISNVVEDTTPQLGGDLDADNYNISNVPVLTATSGNFDVLSFDTNITNPLLAGQMRWDNTEGSLNFGLSANTSIYIGEQRFYRIRNTTGGTLYRGQVVYAIGVHPNGLITPNLYVADTSVPEARFIGAVLEDVDNNQNGYVIDFGRLEGLDLDGSATNYSVGDETWSQGDLLYAHPTVAGKLTNIEPKHSIIVGIILSVGTGSGGGSLLVRPVNFGDLQNNHDISLTSVTHNDILVYNSGTQYWENNDKAVFSDTTGITGASGVSNIVYISSGDYAALGSYDPTTIYFVR
jgi:hypothetical protein